MKNNFFVLILIALLLCGCSKTNSITFTFPDKLDVPDEGKYTVFYIEDLSGNNVMNDDMLPIFLQSKSPDKMSTLIYHDLKDFNQLYGYQFDLNNTPYYIFLDSEENVFQTNDINEAEKFFNENIVN